jgi:hypothetical protein
MVAFLLDTHLTIGFIFVRHSSNLIYCPYCTVRQHNVTMMLF